MRKIVSNLRYSRWIVLFTILLGSSGMLQAQQILGKMILQDISDNAEMRTTIIRSPERALLVVQSQIPNLVFESNNRIFSATEGTPGNWQVILAPGTHRITIRARGFVAMAKRLYFKSKEVKAFQLNIAGSEATSANGEAFGILNLSHIPTDATVLLNGEVIDLSAASNRRLPASTYHLRIEKNGYQPYENVFRLDPGETKAIRVELQRLPQVEQDSSAQIIRQPETSRRKMWFVVAGGGLAAAGAVGYFLLSGGTTPDPGVTPGIPTPVFPGDN